MADETVPKTVGASFAPADALSITQERVRVGLEATWEIDALIEVARDLAESVGHTRDVDQLQLSRYALQLRGVLLRIDRLNSALMSILDDDDDTASLQKKVTGVRHPTEVSHHG